MQTPDVRRAKRHEKYATDRAALKTGATPHAYSVRAAKRFRIRVKALQSICGQAYPACVACGVDDPRLLVVNHKNGGGLKDLRSHRMGSMPVAVMRGKRKTLDLDVRCYNCNILYEYDRGARHAFDWKQVATNAAMEFKR